jgi:hypothetical protein
VKRVFEKNGKAWPEQQTYLAAGIGFGGRRRLGTVVFPGLRQLHSSHSVSEAGCTDWKRNIPKADVLTQKGSIWDVHARTVDIAFVVTDR